jgi:hypothetical protein
LCEAPGFARAEVSVSDFDPKRGVDGLAVELGRGGTIEGRVLVPEGRDPGGVIVGVTRYDLAPRTLRTGSDGTYRFEGLTPGAWRVKRMASEPDPSTGGTSFSAAREEIRYETDCVVEEGKVTTFDLDLRQSFDVVLAGRVFVNGEPAAGWSVIVWPDAAHLHSAKDLPGGTVDERGSVRVVMPRPGKVRVQLLPVIEKGTPIEFNQEMEMLPGDNAWIVDVATGVVEGESASGRGGSLRYEWMDGGVLKCSRDFAAGEDGKWSLPVVPCGEGRIVDQRGGEGRGTVREFVVMRGQVTKVAMP